MIGRLVVRIVLVSAACVVSAGLAPAAVVWQPARVSEAARANSVVRMRNVVFMQISFFIGPSWRRAYERRMNPVSVLWFSVDGLLHVLGRSRRGGRTFVASRPYRHGVVDDRALHTIAANVAVFKCRR